MSLLKDLLGFFHMAWNKLSKEALRKQRNAGLGGGGGGGGGGSFTHNSEASVKYQVIKFFSFFFSFFLTHHKVFEPEPKCYQVEDVCQFDPNPLFWDVLFPPLNIKSYLQISASPALLSCHENPSIAFLLCHLCASGSCTSTGCL